MESKRVSLTERTRGSRAVSEERRRHSSPAAVTPASSTGRIPVTEKIRRHSDSAEHRQRSASLGTHVIEGQVISPRHHRGRSYSRSDDRHQSSVSRHRSSSAHRTSQAPHRSPEVQIRMQKYPTVTTERRRASGDAITASADRRSADHTKKLAACLFFSVLVGCGVGAGIGYGVYSLNFPASNDAVSPYSGEERGTYGSSNSGNAVQEKSPNVDYFPDTDGPVIAGRVGINSAECGTLDSTVQSQIGRKKRDEGPSRAISGRIVGGKDQPIEYHPWQVSLWTGRHTCGGAIISSNWILFAAHCVSPYPYAENWTVFAGESDRRNMQTRSQVVKVSDLVAHEHFNEDTYENDVALLRLKRDLKLGRNVRTACLPTGSRTVIENKICDITGWGAKREGGSMPHYLQKAEVRIIKRDTCNGDDWLMGMVSQNMFCAGTDDGSRDACQGDSGGPLTCYDSSDGKSYLMGAVSWGIGCGEKFMPGVYTNLPKYFGWIEDAIKRAEARYLYR